MWCKEEEREEILYVCLLIVRQLLKPQCALFRESGGLLLLLLIGPTLPAGGIYI